MKRNITAVLVLAACAGLAAAAGKALAGKGLQTGKPGKNIYTELAPGSAAPLPRPYPEAPPLIPHGIADLSVTRAANDCLGCHLEGAELGEGHKATKAPASHFTNPHTKETREDRVVGMRYNCLQCHVPQTAGTPPVPQAP